MTRLVPDDCPLTQRQYECMTLVAEGLNYRQTGEVLGISTSTVANHMLQAEWVLGAHNMRDGIAAFARAGWQRAAPDHHRDYSHARPRAA